MQFVNPFHLWQLWDPEIRTQRRCLARHNELMGQKVTRLRTHPPEPHTIAGKEGSRAAAHALGLGPTHPSMATCIIGVDAK